MNAGLPSSFNNRAVKETDKRQTQKKKRKKKKKKKK